MESNHNESTMLYAVIELQDKAHRDTLKKIIIGWVVSMILALLVIGIGIIMFTQYDVVSYEQDGDGNNVIGNENRSFFYEPEIDCTPEA